MPINKVTCECGCSVTYTNLARHRKTPKHMELMLQCNVCYPPERVAEIPETTEQKVAVIKMLKKSPIDTLPQPIQDMIYEYAADTKAKDNFITAFPELMRLATKYAGGFRNALSATIQFYNNDSFLIRYKDDSYSRITQFKGLDDLREYIYKHSSKRWLHLSKYTHGDIITAITYGHRNDLFDTIHLSLDMTKKHKLIQYDGHNEMYDSEIAFV